MKPLALLLTTLRAAPALWCALVCAALLTIGTNRIIGDWYSPTLHYRHQVDAFLKGGLAVATDPSNVDMDLTYTNGGVHQVWGLGIPLWRLPFALVARLAGVKVLPDRITVVAAMALWAFQIWHVFVFANPALKRRGASSAHRRRDTVAWTLAALIILGFPSFITLLTTRPYVYEEAVLFEYIYATGLFAGLVWLWQKPALNRFLWLCLLAGFGPLVRPTLIFYGAGTGMAGLAVLLAQRGRWDGPYIARCAAGGLLAATLGLGVFFLTNWLRFGSPMEMGHRLNINPAYGAMYMTRFDSAYDRVSTWDSAKELFGFMFLTANAETPDWNFFARDFFPGQADAPRWRELYFRSYNLSYLPLLLGGLWIAARHALRSARQWKQGRRLRLTLPGLALLWAVPPLIGLTHEYLQRPILSSRYVCDYAPAFAAILLCLLRPGGRSRRRARWQAAAAVSLCLWLGLNVYWGWVWWPGPQVDVEHIQYHRPSARLPDHYELMPESASKTTRFRFRRGLSRIRYNGAGWDYATGETKPMAVFFISEPKFIELDVMANRDVNPGRPGWDSIEARVQLEPLVREKITRIPGGRRIRFRAPQQEEYRSGTQVLFVAFGPPETAGDDLSAFRLQAIRWRKPAR